MSSEPKKPLRRAALIALALAGASLLSACQVRPLYDSEGATAARLGSISFSEASTRVGQEVRNRLIFLTSGGAGEPATADYDVDLKVSSSVSKLLLIDSSDTARAAKVTVSATYSITRNSDSQILKSGRRSAVALVDYSIQEFANTRAVLDAEDRAAKELAELVRADIATALSR